VNRQEGFTLVELLVAMTVMLIVLFATFGAFENFSGVAQKNTDQNDQQAQARNALDQLSRQMRNHAAAAPDQQLGIDKATAYDLVFQTVDTPKPGGTSNSHNVRRVRYCLDSSVPDNEKLYFQFQTWTTAATPAVPSTTVCPDPAWPGTARILADHIVNRVNSQDRAVWTPNAAVTSHISTIQTQLYVDLNAARLPREQALDTSISLRNENQAPVATFVASVNANGSVVLNATGSYDPEGERVSYEWRDGSTSIGEDLAFTWDDPTPGSHDVSLIVTDLAGLSETTTQTVVIP
jgi:prepilin-type N-terminal cleavage/methylation domain-containing protein